VDVGSKRKRNTTEEEFTEEFDGLVGSKVFLLPNGTVPINKTITSMIEIIKPHIRTLVEEVNLVSNLLLFLVSK